MTLYEVGSVKHKALKTLALNDASFRLYLESEKVNINRIDSMSEMMRASLIRKVIAIVMLRLEYRTINSDVDSKYRSRKNPKLYTGASSIFTLVEGNPRWFIGIMNHLINDYVESHAINRSKQSQVVTQTISRYRAMLRTISIPSSSNSTPRGILSLVDTIGKYFSKKAIVDDFSPEPPLTFTVDSNVDHVLYQAIGKALNAGAIIYIPDDDGDGLMQSMKGKRFRISYIFAPYYKLPLLLGRSISLMTILKPDISIKKQRTLFEDQQ